MFTKYRYLDISNFREITSPNSSFFISSDLDYHKLLECAARSIDMQREIIRQDGRKVQRYFKTMSFHTYHVFFRCARWFLTRGHVTTRPLRAPSWRSPVHTSLSWTSIPITRAGKCVAKTEPGGCILSPTEPGQTTLHAWTLKTLILG